MTTDPRLLKLELRIKDAIRQDNLRGHGAIILATPSDDLLPAWERFAQHVKPSPAQASSFWANVKSLDALDAYDAGRCLYALTYALQSVTAHADAAPNVAENIFTLAEIFSASAHGTAPASYTRVQHAAGTGALLQFSDPKKYIETIINAVYARRQQ